MPDVPRVSVVLPVHNGLPYLPSALESVLSEEGPSFEVVVVDDGSTDGSGQAAAALGDPRVRVLTQPRRGVAAALNRGLAEARAPLIARMDGDDVALPGRLADQVAWMDRLPDAAAVSGTVRFIDAGGRPMDSRLRPNPRWGRRPRRSLLRLRNPVAHPAVMFRREVVLALGGYDEAYEGAEDFELWLRLTRRHRIVCRPEPVLLLRKHGGNYGAARRTVVATLAAALRERALELGADEDESLRECCREVAEAFVGSALGARWRAQERVADRLRARRPPALRDLFTLLRYGTRGGGALETELRELAEQCVGAWLARTGAPVSVVIPFYRGQETVGRALDSLARQSVPPREVVVVDDGSDPPYRPEGEGLPFPVRVVRHGENRGIPAARNTGIEAADQPWVAFLDQDDEWLPGKLERQWRAVLSSRHPRETVFYGRCRVEGDLHPTWTYPGRRGVRRLDRGKRRAYRFLFLHDNQVALQTVLVPRDLLVRHSGLDESLRGGCDDYELVLRLAAEGAGFHCTDPPGQVGAVRHLTGNSYSHPPRFFTDHMAILEAHGERYGLPTGLRRRFEARAHFRLARHHVKTGRPAEARRGYRAAMAAWPLWPRPYLGLLLLRLGLG